MACVAITQRKPHSKIYFDSALSAQVITQMAIKIPWFLLAFLRVLSGLRGEILVVTCNEFGTIYFLQ